ncbi:splicing factor C9orf78 isoform X1 [Tachypleus tridentatus]|uniref:splicing factor C9orf78 isoform X1 n=1 Tax=Tachypleus tridentatus TaxID=6853 RepID=UPI003FD08893
MEEKNEDAEVVKFKKRNRNIRRRRFSGSDDNREEEDSSEIRSVLEDTKIIQSLRKRPHGVSVLGITGGKKVCAEKSVEDDPFKLKSGGIVNMKNIKTNRVEDKDLDVVNLGHTFSVETNRRDEDADMMKYIDEELAKRKGVEKKDVNRERRKEDTQLSDDVLFQVPEHLRQSSSKQSEEMLSNQMLSGIPEVDLGIEERIRNIEATEESKLKMLKERMAKKETGTSFVPTNMAVNFVQHNRFNIEESAESKAKLSKEKLRQPVVNINEAENSHLFKIKKNSKMGEDEKATDDFHFEKFKKQFRRF